MDFEILSDSTIRARAVNELAEYSAKMPKNENPESNGLYKTFLSRLLQAATFGNSKSSSISPREVENVIALCKYLENSTDVAQLDVVFEKLSLFFIRLPSLNVLSPVGTSSWPTTQTELAFTLTSAFCNASSKSPALKSQVESSFLSFLENFKVGAQSPLRLSYYFALIGFIDALQKSVFFVTAYSSSIIQKLIDLLTAQFFIQVEVCMSEISEIEDQMAISRFEAEDSEFSSLLLMKLYKQLLVEHLKGHTTPEAMTESLLPSILKRAVSSQVVNGNGNGNGHIEESEESREFTTVLKQITEHSIQDAMAFEAGGNDILLSTYSRQQMASCIQASSLQIIALGVEKGVVDLSEVENITKRFMGDPSKVAYHQLADSLFGLVAMLSFKNRKMAHLLARKFPTLLLSHGLTGESASAVAASVAISLSRLSQEDIISTVYSITNILAPTSDFVTQRKKSFRNVSGLEPPKRISSRTMSPVSSLRSVGSAQRSVLNHIGHSDFGVELTSQSFENVLAAAVSFCKVLDDEQITVLMVTILCQKFGSVSKSLDIMLLKTLGTFMPIVDEREFLHILKLFTEGALKAVRKSDSAHKDAIIDIWVSVSESVASLSDTEIYRVYLHELLIGIANRGDDVRDLEHHRSNTEVSAVAQEIAIYFKPLAHLFPSLDTEPAKFTDLQTINLFKDAWFNLVVHGYSLNSEIGILHKETLKRIAYSSPPLADEYSWSRTETSIELNSVLRRGTSKHTEKLHKDSLSKTFSPKALDNAVFEFKISRPKLMFLAATLFLEDLRVETGDCSTSLIYFSDPSVAITGVQKYIGNIAVYITLKFIREVHRGGSATFAMDNVSEQLKKMLILCCHRDYELQDAAFQCCNYLIQKIPSSLCHHTSLFSLLDLLSLLFQSIVDADTNEYEPKVKFQATASNITLNLSDSYEWRRAAWQKLHKFGTSWTKLALMKCNYDMKSLLQAYISQIGLLNIGNIHFGVSFALEMAGSVLPSDRELSNLGVDAYSKTNTLAGFLSQFQWRNSFKNDILIKVAKFKTEGSPYLPGNVRRELQSIETRLHENVAIPSQELMNVLGDCTAVVIISPTLAAGFIGCLVRIPFKVFTSEIIDLAIGLWLTAIKERPDASAYILAQILSLWEEKIRCHDGLFNSSLTILDATYSRMEYLPTSKAEMDHLGSAANKKIKPHLLLIRLLGSHFEATMYRSDHVLKMFTQTFILALKGLRNGSLHPFARLARFELIDCALNILAVHISLKSRDVGELTSAILNGALSWFKLPQSTPFGGNKLKIKADYKLLQTITRRIAGLYFKQGSSFLSKKTLLLAFLEHEVSVIASWLDPLNPSDPSGTYLTSVGKPEVLDAFYANPRLAINLVKRYKLTSLNSMLRDLLLKHPLKALDEPFAVEYLLHSDSRSYGKPSKHLLLWSPLPPVDSIKLFMPPFNDDPFILQYTMRSLESHDVNLTFFYVPQIVQSLRHDSRLAYVRRFILETAKVSQLFAHQIIWNMLANRFKDEDSEVPDSIKPTLDEIMDAMLKTFSKKDFLFYEQEFRFFEEVTGISGKLKPYIKKSKAEKKAKIDEEMDRIIVKPGVYLPSNPDGVVVDINRKSGRPLQSHAKAPFMATFKIKKEIPDLSDDSQSKLVTIEQWMSAIFKVGDDCRQDVLALQLISVFRTIWTHAGLDVYVFPYRVTATAPGCGIIDVLPNSVSRDMLGREAVNGLYEYFISRFGPENSTEFQTARNNFVKSLAAYSVISYLLQFKDRHNGNIMYDDQGHILHIDFGFCFDIVPGGVKFEQSPFKLTKEMVRVMGGGQDTQAYKWFEELCVKAFLACRPYMDTIINCVVPMTESGLPCFKPATIKKLRARFVPEKSEKDAAIFMQGLIKKSFESASTKGYDEFQRLTNGIPY
ncbi:unnamed protein product [Kuraishia capsulata CBS 1993]|uniref:1-phosphatidylinositol 4-kinase n=1 Tax=Kuraishia capsulata CBS 1993 TaxID=1382522 RepID=W6MUZ1_9ASCO|nr:uncharacterized protein KUCA_T00005660001 [Kuraishia capsulata CBS 1993]CDK29667.1 unnamed protein product [Kuraishia capsulata CBS 1993]